MPESPNPGPEPGEPPAGTGLHAPSVVPPPGLAQDAPAVNGGAAHGRPAVRYLVIVSRTRADLFPFVRRQFLGDPAIEVLVDRRREERRRGAGAAPVPERRQRDRRRPTDFWEDLRFHPVVLVPAAARGGDQPAEPDHPVPTVVRRMTMEETLPADVDERVVQWIEEGRHMLGEILPALVRERDELRARVRETEQECARLQDENRALRDEVPRLQDENRALREELPRLQDENRALREDVARRQEEDRALRDAMARLEDQQRTLRAELQRLQEENHKLARGHAEIVEHVGRFMGQMTQVLTPMKELAEMIQRRPD